MFVFFLLKFKIKKKFAENLKEKNKFPEDLKEKKSFL